MSDNILFRSGITFPADQLMVQTMRTPILTIDAAGKVAHFDENECRRYAEYHYQGYRDQSNIWMAAIVAVLDMERAKRPASHAPATASQSGQTPNVAQQGGGDE